MVFENEIFAKLAPEKNRANVERIWHMCYFVHMIEFNFRLDSAIDYILAPYWFST